MTADERGRARALWADGRTLGEIADALGCGIYALSPWLYTEDTPPNRELRDALHMTPGDDD